MPGGEGEPGGEMQRLLDRVHQGVTTFDYEGTIVPCVVLGQERFEGMVAAAAGRPASVDTNLNILQDGEGHVFVELVLDLAGARQAILLNANTSVEFFELLAGTSMLALLPARPGAGGADVFMIQLPRPERAARALEVIKKGLGQGG